MWWFRSPRRSIAEGDAQSFKLGMYEAFVQLIHGLNGKLTLPDIEDATGDKIQGNLDVDIVEHEFTDPAPGVSSGDLAVTHDVAHELGFPTKNVLALLPPAEARFDVSTDPPSTRFVTITCRADASDYPIKTRFLIFGARAQRSDES